MQIYRYWVRKTVTWSVEPLLPDQPFQGADLMPSDHKTATGQHAVFYGYSNESMEAAQTCAEKLAQLVAKRIRNENSSAPWDYSNGKPIREELLQWIDSDNAITRNRYGAEILNSNNLVILDVDLPLYQPRTLWQILWKKVPPAIQQPEEYALQILQKVAESPSYMNFPIRVYRTRGGLRLIVQHCSWQADSPECSKLFRAFHCDKLYSTLCAKQQCFRARLTPKPYRIHQTSRKFFWPEDSTIQREAWLEAYREKSKNYAVCRYLFTWNGNRKCNELIQYHDEKTGSFSSLPLA